MVIDKEKVNANAKVYITEAKNDQTVYTKYQAS